MRSLTLYILKQVIFRLTWLYAMGICLCLFVCMFSCWGLGVLPLSEVCVVLWGRPDVGCHCDLWGSSLHVEGRIGGKKSTVFCQVRRIPTSWHLLCILCICRRCSEHNSRPTWTACAAYIGLQNSGGMNVFSICSYCKICFKCFLTSFLWSNQLHGLFFLFLRF